MAAFEYVMPDNFEAAASFLSREKREDVLVKAGGVDVVDRLKEGIDSPKRILSLRQLRDVAIGVEVRAADRTFALHALASLAQLALNKHMRQWYPAIAESAEDAATPQIRNVATVAGNLLQKPRCWYYRSADFKCLKKGGSTCYAVEGDNRFHAIVGAGACHIVHPSNVALGLIVHNARLRLIKHEGGAPQERYLPIEDFFRVPVDPRDDENVLGPTELVREIVLPNTAQGPRSTYVSIKEKQSFDWPLACCAVNLNDRAKPRIVLGAVAPIPWRLAKVEEMLAGQEISDALIARAKTAAIEGAKPMTRNGYKLQLAGVVLERALRAVSARS